LIVPVVESLHWSVLFVCNVDQIVPRIIHAWEVGQTKRAGGSEAETRKEQGKAPDNSIKPMTAEELAAAKARLDAKRTPLFICMDSLSMHDSQKHVALMKTFLKGIAKARISLDSKISPQIIDRGIEGIK